MIRLAFLLTCATALQCELAVSLDGLDFVSTFPVEADLRVWSSFLVERIQERTGEPFDEAARLRVLENMEAARQDQAILPANHEPNSLSSTSIKKCYSKSNFLISYNFIRTTNKN